MKWTARFMGLVVIVMGLYIYNQATTPPITVAEGEAWGNDKPITWKDRDRARRKALVDSAHINGYTINRLGHKHGSTETYEIIRTLKRGDVTEVEVKLKYPRAKTELDLTDPILMDAVEDEIGH